MAITDSLRSNIVDLAVDVSFSNTAVEDARLLSRYIEARLRELIDERRPWDYTAQEIGRMVLPQQYFIDGLNDGTALDYDSPLHYLRSLSQSIYNMDAPQAINTLTAGMLGHVLNQNAPWFAYTTAKENMRDRPGVLQYLADVSEQLIGALGRSNFYSECVPMVQNCAGLGTSALYFEPDEHNNYSFRTIPWRELYVADNSQRRIDTAYRVFSVTKRQAIQQFGYENLSDRLKKVEDDTIRFNVVHAVFPREDARDQTIGLSNRAPRSLLSRDAPYISVWKELDGQSGTGAWHQSRGGDGQDVNKLLKVGGYRHFPYAVWRWQIPTPFPYGIGPTQLLLPTIYQANFFDEMLVRSAQLHVEPPWQIPPGLQMEPDITPGGFTILANPQQRILALDRAGGNYPYGTDRAERTSAMIRDFYGVDYFMLITASTGDASRATATEIYSKESEKATVLNSMMGRWGYDVAHPVLTNLFYWEQMAGRMPEPPPALDEFRRTELGRLKLEYISPLALAQRRTAFMVGPIRAFEAMMQVLQSYPAGMDALKIPQFVRRMFLAGGWNPADVRTVDEMRQLQQASAERMQQQQQLEGAESMARTARNAGVDLSNQEQAQQGQQVLQSLMAGS